MNPVRAILPILLAATVQAASGDEPPECGAAGIVGGTARAVALDPDADPVPATAISNAEAVFRMRKAVEGFFETRDGYDDYWIRIVRTNGLVGVRWIANVSGNGPAADGLETGMQLARFSFDPDSRRLEPIPAATNLSDAAAIRIVKEKMPGLCFPGDCPWLLERVSGIMVVGVPRRLGWHGTMVFDPIVWIHDGTGAVLAVLCEPD